MDDDGDKILFIFDTLLLQDKYAEKFLKKIRITRRCFNSYLLDANVADSTPFEDELCRKTNSDTITLSDLSVEVIILRGNDLHREGVLSHYCQRYCPQLKVNLIIMASMSKKKNLKQIKYIKVS